jgi:phage-related protein
LGRYAYGDLITHNAEIAGRYDTYAREYVEEAWEQYAKVHGEILNNNESDVNFSLNYSDTNFYYQPSTSSCDAGFYRTQTFQVVNNGTAAAPCRVTIIPKSDIMLLSIEGLSDEKIEVHKVQKGQVLILDGIDRKITLDAIDAFDIYDGWEFPKLRPGTNTIKITNASLMTLSIEYQPRYI